MWLQHRVTEAVAGDVLFAVQQDEAHAVAAVRPQEAVGDVGMPTCLFTRRGDTRPEIQTLKTLALAEHARAVEDGRL